MLSVLDPRIDLVSADLLAISVHHTCNLPLMSAPVSSPIILVASITLRLRAVLVSLSTPPRVIDTV